MERKDYNGVRAARCGYNYSQKEVADILGIDVRTYQYKESGRGKWNNKEIAALSNLFNFSISEINRYFYDGILPIGNE